MKQEIVSFKTSDITLRGVTLRMMVILQLTSLIKYKKLKTENHFFEMLTATVSHDMRTPLNAINGLA